MASGSEKYEAINKNRSTSSASKRGNTMKDIASRNNGSDTPF